MGASEGVEERSPILPDLPPMTPPPSMEATVSERRELGNVHRRGKLGEQQGGDEEKKSKNAPQDSDAEHEGVGSAE